MLARLPQDIAVTRFALDKAFKINELVRRSFKDSFEWYGFTLAAQDRPEIIIDIGLPVNEENILEYASLVPEKIAAYQEDLSPELVINGWIHSHGSMDLRRFSAVDEANHRTVLDYVTTKLRQPVAKREIVINDLTCLVEGRYQEADLKKGSVSLLTDTPVKEAVLLETIVGSFCYAIVIGDDGWHHQEIHYKSRGILSGQSEISKQDAELHCVDAERGLSAEDIRLLSREVREKIRPVPYKPEIIERM
jgi:hypothetical protein